MKEGDSRKNMRRKKKVKEMRSVEIKETTEKI